MNSNELRQKFLAFFEKRGHAVLPSASLIPENDPSVLFTTAGMQPLVPHLLGQKHSKGNKLVNIQKCVRTGDIDEIGDNTHATFFEMMGNWSLGDYFKEEAIQWSYELLTNKQEGFGLDPERLYVTVFEGDDNAPKDTESAEIWKKIGIPESRIYYMPAKNNWWSPGDNGPCGPDTEMFYDIVGGLNLTSKEEFVVADEKQHVVEIWNDVFMEYQKKDGKVIGKLNQKNVDTGSGFERVLMVLQGKDNIYDTDLFDGIFGLIGNQDKRESRIIADHLRTALFMIADGARPSNKDQGYILRRLIRRAAFKMKKMMLAEQTGVKIIETFIKKYSNQYDNLNNPEIILVFRDEETKFLSTLTEGMKEYEKGNNDPFVLWTSYGFPIELTVELEKTKGRNVDLDKFKLQFEAHQALSRSGSEQKFKGGLANHDENTIKLHTAHHLLLAALQKHVDPKIKQKGSNITSERLRMDFSFDRKLTDEEKKMVENQVNEWITDKLDVVRKEMPKEEAEKLGAEMEFGAKYPDIVSVYLISGVSKEFCGGPHVTNTGELGTFKIAKEEAVAQGVRRIKATLN